MAKPALPVKASLDAPNEVPWVGNPLPAWGLRHTQTVRCVASVKSQPLGIPGELYIAGDGLARGYLNRPELTAEKFIEAELFGKTERIYNTGDLARWLPDGSLEFLGRIDHQIKLRGFRIELGEIEAAISQYEGVKESVVSLYEADGNKRLVAYLTIAEGESSTVNEPLFIDGLRDGLKARLPDYMIPASFMILDSLPLTPNGKIDRKALPAPGLQASTGFIQANTPTEELLAVLWANVLKREAVGRNDNFFELGGHSLLATRLVSRIRESFRVELPIRAVFEHPQLARLATAIDNANKMWLMERHTSLRTYFPHQDGEAKPAVHPMASIEALTIVDLRPLATEDQPAEVQRLVNAQAMAPFDLGQGPLFKAELLLLDEHESVLLLNMHHIISDGWSMGVMLRDWQHAYTAFALGNEPGLPPLAIQYSDYAAWQRQWFQGEVLERQVTYWARQLDGLPELLELPTGQTAPPATKLPGGLF